MTFGYDTYLSPFTFRYGSLAMRQLWSEKSKRLAWRQIWLALAETQAEYSLVTQEQIDDLKAHVDDINLERSLEIELLIRHDLMAELQTYAEQATLGGPVLHLGATSADIEDNADALRMRKSLMLVLHRLTKLLLRLADLVDEYADLPLMAFTHLQPAEPSTLGYRMAQYAQDLKADWDSLQAVLAGLRGKGFKGAVGTGAAYAELIGAEQLANFELLLSGRLGLPFFPVTTQVYPRKQDYQVISALAGLGGSLYKLAFDLRLLQSPPVGELSEHFGALQVGSSAMPFKRNPINSEKVNSLARMLAQMPRLAWDNAAHSLLERTLDDSANRRSLLPEAFLITDELLLTADRILSGLNVDEIAMQRNLDAYAPFAAVERVLTAAAKAGASRQTTHEHLRRLSLLAWETLQTGRPNPLVNLLVDYDSSLQLLGEKELARLLDVSEYLGDAPARARSLAQSIRTATHGR